MAKDTAHTEIIPYRSCLTSIFEERYCFGQLDGTIPSTIAAQAKDKSAFVDASELWLPDLGEIADLKDGYH